MKSIDFDYASDNIIWGCIFTKTRKEIFLRPNNKIKWKVSYGSAVVTFVCSFAANNLNTLNIYNFFIVKYYMSGAVVILSKAGIFSRPQIYKG